jgi:hypothetical protein
MSEMVHTVKTNKSNSKKNLTDSLVQNGATVNFCAPETMCSEQFAKGNTFHLCQRTIYFFSFQSCSNIWMASCMWIIKWGKKNQRNGKWKI